MTVEIKLTKLLGICEHLLEGREIREILPREDNGEYIIDTEGKQGYLNFRDPKMEFQLGCLPLDDDSCYLNVGAILSKEVAAELSLRGVIFDKRLIKDEED